MRRLLTCLLALSAALAARGQSCSAPYLVRWPTPGAGETPLWEFCWQRPASSSLANGEGIKIYDLKYKGVRIVKDASIPVLNVQYNPGGCGGSVLCYRDWFDQERGFECTPGNSTTGFCSGTGAPFSTTCDHPGTDLGTFKGVAVLDQGSRLRLVSQAQAGWYRYIATWEFYPDGSFHPGMDITAVTSSCVQYTHRHHAYWRIDFDLGPGGDNSLSLHRPGGLTGIASERSFVDIDGARSWWRVSSASSPVRVDVMRTPDDGGWKGDTFVRGDAWALAYKSNELDDGPHGQSQCPIDLDNYVGGENLAGADVVLWVHSGLTHDGEPGGVPADCHTFGPLLRVNLAGDAVAPSLALPAGAGCPGAAPALTATLPADAAGEVEFFDGNIRLGSAPIVNGVATFAAPAYPDGSAHTLHAAWGGDAKRLGGWSADRLLRVSPAPSPARSLTAAGAGTTQFAWSPPQTPGSAPLTYDLLRSATPGDFATAACAAAQVSAQNAQDAYAGSAFYLVRAVNDCGGSIPGPVCP